MTGRRSRGAPCRPRVTLCYAQSLDGSLAARRRRPLALSCPESLTLTHELRATHDAILVGIGTVLADDPRLTVRLVHGAHPQPVILDSRLRCPLDARLFEHPTRSPWIAATAAADHAREARLVAAGARVWRLPPDARRRVDLAPLLAELRAAGIGRVMVEGGSRVIGSFLKARLVDRLVVTVAPRFVGGLRAVSALGGVAPRLSAVDYRRFGDDLVVTADLAWDD